MIDDPNRSGPNVPQDAPSTKNGDLSEAAEVEQSVCETESPMEQQGVSRRTLLKGGIATLTGLTVLRVAGPVHAFPGHPGEVDGVAWDDDQPDPPHAMAHPGEEVIPWLDQPAENPVPNNVGNLLDGRPSTPG